MYRTFADQYEKDRYHNDEWTTPLPVCLDGSGRPKDSHKKESSARTALRLAAKKAEEQGRVAPVRYYACTNPEHSCFGEFHLTHVPLRPGASEEN